MSKQDVFRVYVEVEDQDRDLLIAIFQERHIAEEMAIELEMSHSINSRVQHGIVLRSMIDTLFDSRGNMVDHQAYKELTGSHYY